MKTVLRPISYLGLALTLIPPFLVWTGKLALATNFKLLVAGMLLWFGTAVLWIKEDKTEA